MTMILLSTYFLVRDYSELVQPALALIVLTIIIVLIIDNEVEKWLV